MNNQKTLDGIGVGERAVIGEYAAEGSVGIRLADLGFLRGREVRCVGRAPLGDPLMLTAGGRVIAMRGRDLAAVTVLNIRGESFEQKDNRKNRKKRAKFNTGGTCGRS